MLSSIASELAKGRKLVLMHGNADPDALGCAYAIFSAFPDVTVVTPGGMDRISKLIAEKLQFVVAESSGPGGVRPHRRSGHLLAGPVGADQGALRLHRHRPPFPIRTLERQYLLLRRDQALLRRDRLPHAQGGGHSDEPQGRPGPPGRNADRQRSFQVRHAGAAARLRRHHGRAAHRHRRGARPHRRGAGPLREDLAAEGRAAAALRALRRPPHRHQLRQRLRELGLQGDARPGRGCRIRRQPEGRAVPGERPRPGGHRAHGPAPGQAAGGRRRRDLERRRGPRRRGRPGRRRRRGGGAQHLHGARP